MKALVYFCLAVALAALIGCATTSPQPNAPSASKIRIADATHQAEDGAISYMTARDWAKTPGLVIVEVSDTLPSGDASWFLPPNRDVFKPGELPMAVAYGCGGKNVTMELFDNATGASMEKKTRMLDKDTMMGRAVRVGQGTYRVEVSVDGVKIQSASFKVVQ